MAPTQYLLGSIDQMPQQTQDKTAGSVHVPMFSAKNKNYVSITNVLREQCMTIVCIEYKLLSGPYVSRVPESPHGGPVVLRVTVHIRLVW